MKLYSFFCHDMGEEALHVVCAESVSEAAQLFVKGYRGLRTDELVIHRLASDTLLLAAEEVAGRHVQIEWIIEEHEIAKGVLV